MKPTLLLLSGFILTLLNTGIVNAQLNTETPTPVSVFNKGNFFTDLSSNIGFDFLTLKTGDVKSGKSNSSGFHYKTTYMLLDGIGVGAGISGSRSKYMPEEINGIEGVDIINSSISGSVNALYGQDISAVLNAYVKAEVRFGRTRYQADYPGSLQDQKQNLFGINLEAGLPWVPFDSNGCVITPVIGYSHSTSKDDYLKDINSGFYFGTRLNMSLPCSHMAHSCDESRAFAENMYSKGANVIGGSSYFMINTGTETNKYTSENGYGDYDTKHNFYGGMFNAEYYRYLFNNFAIGGGTELQVFGQKNKETENKYTDFSWKIKPTVQLNLPVTGELNNTFLFGGVVIGGSKDKSTNQEEITENKYNSSGFRLGVGHHVFMAKGFSLVPVINFASYTDKNTESDIKNVSSGIETGLSMRYNWHCQ